MIPANLRLQRGLAAQIGDAIKNGLETDVDCGGPSCAICPTVLLLAGGNTGPNGDLGASFTAATGWTTTALAGVTVDGVALAMNSANLGVGLVRYTKIGDPQDNQLQFTTWNKGVWTPPAQVGTNTTRGWPAASSGGSVVHALFHGVDFNYYYAAYANGMWSPASQASGSFGPIAGDIAGLGANAAIFFNDGNAANRITSRDRVAGLWQAIKPYATQVNINISPAIVPMTSGAAELLGFWPYNLLGPVRYGFRTGGVWGAAFDVPGLKTNDRIDAAALPSGNVAVVFRGQDGKFYGLAYVNAVWSPVVTVPGAPNITGTPAVSPGIGTALAEAVYVSGGQLFHTRLVGMAWTAPTLVGGADIRSVALARSN